MNDIRVQTVIVPIDNLIPNPWNPNKMDDFMMQRERASISKFGFIDPCLTRSTEEEGIFEIIDGEQRWNAAKAEGFTEISINNLGEVSDPVAKQLTIVLNETKGTFDTFQLAELVRDIETELGEALGSVEDAEAELRAVLPYEDEEYQALRNLLSVDWDVSAMDDAEVSSTSCSEDTDGLREFSAMVSADQLETIHAAFNVIESAGVEFDGDENPDFDGNCLEMICAHFRQTWTPK